MRKKDIDSRLAGIYRLIPTMLTIGRILLAPVVAWMIGRSGAVWPIGPEVAPEWLIAAFWLSALAAASDWLDGFLARRLAAQTRLGLFLDPIADKIFVGVVLCTVTAMSGFRWEIVVPVTAIVCRDIVVTALRLIGGEDILTPSPLARVKTGVFMVLILAVPLILLLGGPFPVVLLWLVFLWAGAILSLSTALTLRRRADS